MSYRISVLISTYDDAEFVSKKLNEIRKQSIFKQAEFIFIETASPGNERQLLKPFCQEHDNCKVVALNERKTLYEAWNIGWDISTAQVICYSNMDDCMHPRLLEEVVTAMDEKHWDACSVLIAQQPLNKIYKKDMWSVKYLSALKLSHRPGPFTAWRSSLKYNIGQFDGDFYGAGDKDFWARIQAAGNKYGLIHKVLYLYSKSQQQLSKSSAGSENRKKDKNLASGKPYILKWPYRRFPYYYWLQLQLRLLPRTLCLDMSQKKVSGNHQHVT
jgi:glycosyltransferase involved in cell wall biosynthesis